MVAEANRQLVHEEMLRNSMIKTVKEAVEIERQERIKILEEMANGKSDSYEIADTNAKRSEVHQELKKLFRYVEVKKYSNSISAFYHRLIRNLPFSVMYFWKGGPLILY